VIDNGMDTKLFDLAKSVHWIVDDSSYTNDGGKRRRLLPGGADDSDDENASAPPTHDIYRLRQQKRLK
jgi:cleavage stimulation factor subunit 3